MTANTTEEAVADRFRDSLLTDSNMLEVAEELAGEGARAAVLFNALRTLDDIEEASR